MPANFNGKIDVIFSLFKGRDDIFAIRWEKEGKTGYIPAYDLNWEDYSKYKAGGGTLKDFPHKQYSRITPQRIINHLNGKEVIGIYPLLIDNTSWFIAADFDERLATKKSWIEECRLFIDSCNSYGLPAYLERSRSGKGGHVWIFFESAYPAYKSRKIVLQILELTGIISPLDKNTNYDRLFPNQDYHSGKGMGNLIALPFQKKAVENNNTCFIDPVNQQPFEDQVIFLQNIQKVSAEHLDTIFHGTKNSTPLGDLAQKGGELDQSELQIWLKNQVLIQRKLLLPELINFLRDNLNFINSDYIIKKKLGKNTFATEPYFRMLQEKNGVVLLPRGFIGKLIRYCKDQGIKYELVDQRQRLTEVNYAFKASLYDYQQAAVDITHKKEMGVIVAPPGSGKTIIGLGIVALKKQPALIIVHRKQLFDQWVDRIQSFLGIADPFIGKIWPGSQKIGTHITVAMIQSLATLESNNEIFLSFGLIIIDECHHVPAKTFRQVITNFSSYFLYGLTATPIRKNNDEKLIFIHIGDVVHEVKFPKENSSYSKKLSVIIRETNLLVPFDYKTDKPETVYQILIHDSARNQLIVEDVRTETNAGKKVLVLTERKAHIEVLRQYLKNHYEVITISGEDPSSTRKTKLKQIEEGLFQVLISTGQFLGEGTDFDNLSCLMLAYPLAFEGRLIQYIGRVQRTNDIPIIYDYRDIGVDYLERQFRLRNRYYKTLLDSGELLKFDELVLIFSENKLFLNSVEYILPISCLDLPVEVEQFKEGTIWKLRVLKYDEENAEIMTEIMDYNCKPIMNDGKQGSLHFLIVDRIKFRSIDTGKLLNAVILKSNPVIQHVSEPMSNYDVSNLVNKKVASSIEKTLSKILKVPFHSIKFLHALVSFPLYIEELGKEIIFEIDNPDIRPEFEAIKNYFIKVLKKKLINVEIKIRYKADEILSWTAVSEDLDKINSSIIDSVRFEFVKKGILNFKGNGENSSLLNTLDNLPARDKDAVHKIFRSEQDFINDLLNIKDSKHYLQLKYLSTQHLSAVLKIRFVLAPFSFLFLLGGEKKYHIVWETLYSEEATYIWHFEKTIDALRKGLTEIEAILTEIKATSKLDYLKKEHENFSRVVHDYTDVKSGFIFWKGMLEEKVV